MKEIKSFQLDCSHMVYMKMPYPMAGDYMLCRVCNEYVTVGPKDVKNGRIYQEDFWSEPCNKNEYKGGCSFEECEYEITNFKNWFKLRDKLHSHYMNEHTNYGSNLHELLKTVKAQIDPPF